MKVYATYDITDEASPSFYASRSGDYWLGKYVVPEWQGRELLSRLVHEEVFTSLRQLVENWLAGWYNTSQPGLATERWELKIRGPKGLVAVVKYDRGGVVEDLVVADIGQVLDMMDQ